MRHHMKAQHKMVGPIAQMPGSWTRDEPAGAWATPPLPVPPPAGGGGADPAAGASPPQAEDPLEVAKREDAEVNSWFR